MDNEAIAGVVGTLIYAGVEVLKRRFPRTFRSIDNRVLGVVVPAVSAAAAAIVTGLAGTSGANLAESAGIGAAVPGALYATLRTFRRA